MYKNELYHMGVKGMRLGQHIYTKDGSLNRRGQRKFKRVAKNAKKSRAHTIQAKKMLKKYAKYEQRNAKDYQKEANRKSKAGKDFIMTNFKNSKIYNTDILFRDKKNNYSPYVGLLYD